MWKFDALGVQTASPNQKSVCDIGVSHMQDGLFPQLGNEFQCTLLG